MSAESIRATIQSNNALISDYQNSIGQLEGKIYQLQCLKTKISGLQKNFGDNQSERKRKLSGMTAKFVNVKMFSAYLKGMEGLFSGSEYSTAYNGLSEAQGSIDKQINAIQNEINSYRGKITYLYGRNEYWNGKLRDIQE